MEYCSAVKKMKKLNPWNFSGKLMAMEKMTPIQVTQAQKD